MISKKIKLTALPLLAGFLLWLGLSPRASRAAYYQVLMPRCRSDHADVVQTVNAATRQIPFQSGARKLSAHLCIKPESNKLIVYFPGRRSNVEKCWSRAQALLETGVSVLFCEYSGFGDTEGHASIRSLLEDGLALFDVAAHLGYAPENTIVYGESLGAAVATHVSSLRTTGGLILQSGFSSLQAQVKEMLPPLRLYPRCLFPKPEMSSAKILQKEHPPLLIVHGDRDDVVDVKHSYELAQAAGANTELIIMPGGHHADLFMRSDWKVAVSRFVASV